MKHYNYVTKDGVSFDFVIIKENKNTVTILIKDDNIIFSILKDELKKATKV